MACGLKASTTGKYDFTGKVGASFSVEMTGPADSGLTIASMSYNGTTKMASPFTFTVGAGMNFLSIHPL